MNEIYMKVITQQMAAASEANKKRKRKHDPDKPKYEYDSDEDTEGGTWEHKKRATEMQKTAGMWKFMKLVRDPKNLACSKGWFFPIEKFIQSNFISSFLQKKGLRIRKNMVIFHIFLWNYLEKWPRSYSLFPTSILINKSLLNALYIDLQK